MSKVAIIGDIHFGVNKNSELFLASSMTFFKDQLVPYLHKSGIDKIFILGDVYDNRNSINVRINDEMEFLFSDVLKDFEITILVGNHDMYYKTTTKVHSLKFLNHLKNVDVIDELAVKNVDGLEIMISPWIVDYKDPIFKEQCASTKASVLFGHFDIVGFAMNRAKVSTIGLASEDLDNFKRVFSGHYHTPSNKKFGDTEIVYVGSPYQMNRNDMGEKKGFIVFDTDTLKYRRVSNTKSLKFVAVEYPELPEKKDIEGNIVDATINIEKKDLVGNLIDKFVDNIESMNPAEKVNVNLNVLTPENNFDVISHGLQSIPDLLEMYINKDDEIDDKADMLDTVMELYNTIQNK